MATIELLASPDLLNADVSRQQAAGAAVKDGSIFFLGLPEGDEWIPLSRDPAQPTVRDLPPQTYQILAGSANVCPFQLTVTEQGTIQYDPAFEGVLAGNGTNRITFNGLPVTIDARYVSGIQTGEQEFCGGSAGVLFYWGKAEKETGATGSAPIIRYKEGRLLPTKFGYQVAVGSARMSPFNLLLDYKSGNWSYGIVREGQFVEEPGFDRFLNGRGTSTLEFLGYPVIVDARASGAKSLQIIGVLEQLKVTDTLVQHVNMLPLKPGEGYEVMLGGVSGPKRGFFLDVAGKLTPSGPGIQFDAFHQIPRVRVT